MKSRKKDKKYDPGIAESEWEFVTNLMAEYQKKLDERIEKARGEGRRITPRVILGMKNAMKWPIKISKNDHPELEHSFLVADNPEPESNEPLLIGLKSSELRIDTISLRLILIPRYFDIRL